MNLTATDARAGGAPHRVKKLLCHIKRPAAYITHPATCISHLSVGSPGRNVGHGAAVRQLVGVSLLGGRGHGVEMFLRSHSFGFSDDVNIIIIYDREPRGRLRGRERSQTGRTCVFRPRNPQRSLREASDPTPEYPQRMWSEVTKVSADHLPSSPSRLHIPSDHTRPRPPI